MDTCVNVGFLVFMFLCLNDLWLIKRSNDEILRWMKRQSKETECSCR